MKKLLLTVAILAMSMTQKVNAQTEKGLFIGLNGGYNFASGSQNTGSNEART